MAERRRKQYVGPASNGEEPDEAEALAMGHAMFEAIAVDRPPCRGDRMVDMARDDRERGDNQASKDEGYKTWMETETIKKSGDRDHIETREGR